DEATMLMATLTFAVKTSRSGCPPMKQASASRACQSNGGKRRTKKSVGSAANCRRNSVTLSKTHCGSGPKEPVLRLQTAGSSSTAARACCQNGSLRVSVVIAVPAVRRRRCQRRQHFCQLNPSALIHVYCDSYENPPVTGLTHARNNSSDRE